MLKLLSTKEVAEKLGVVESTISYMKKQGEITPVGHRGRTFLYDSEEIEKLLEEFVTLSDGTKVSESYIKTMLERSYEI